MAASPQLKNKINWYEIPYFDLIDSRTIFIDPSYGAVGTDSTATAGANGAYLGIGFNLDNYISIDAIPKSEAVKLRIICDRPIPSSSTPSLSGFSFIGFWNGTTRPQTLNSDYFIFGASSSNYNICSQIEVTVFGSNTTTTTSTQPGATAYPWVFWEAYSYNGKGGWSGYFVLAP
jgi:hypothetical protein